MLRSRRTEIVGWSAGMLGLLGIVIVVSAGIGPVEIAPLTVGMIVLNAVPMPTGVSVTPFTVPVSIPGVGPLSLPWPVLETDTVFSFSVPSTEETIIMTVRLPRIVLGAIVGFALAAAGTVMQGFFRNPMADPSIIGVSAGAALGAVVAITLPVAAIGLRPAAFVGAIVAAFVVYSIATEDGRTPIATLLLAGIAVQTFLGAIISYLLVHSGESLREAVYWLMGHLHNSSWADVGMALPAVALSFGLLALYTPELNVLLLGEEDAQTLGIAVERTKRLLLATASIITAAAVAVSGVIGFVGLIVPHMMRLIVGPDHRILLPTSAIAGGAFLVATDTLARAGPAEVPVGIVTAAVGAPFFIYLLRTREVHAL